MCHVTDETKGLAKKSPDSRGRESGQNALLSKASAQGGKKRKGQLKLNLAIMENKSNAA